MLLADALRMTIEAERALADALLDVSRRHASEPDIRETTRLLAGWSRDHARALATDRTRLGRAPSRRGWQLRGAPFDGPGNGGAELLEDLLALTGGVAFVEACWTIVLQAALASHDPDLEHTARACGAETLRQRAWLDTKLSQLAPQALALRRHPGNRQVGQAAGVSPHHGPPTIRSRSREGVPLVVGVLAGLGRAVATRRRRSASSTASAILAGLGLGWTGRVVIRALADRRSARHLAHDRPRGLRGPIRTARFHDA
jgi:hypothetical protein